MDGLTEGEPLLVELFDKDFNSKEFLGQVRGSRQWPPSLWHLVVTKTWCISAVWQHHFVLTCCFQPQLTQDVYEPLQASIQPMP